MCPLIQNEFQEKKDTLFLKYEQENTLYLKSKLYKILFHYLKEVSKSTICKEKECIFCKNNYVRRTEYNYYVSLNDQLGIINIKPSVFFAIQAIAAASKKETRQMSWLVIRQGQGLDTEYTVSKNENLSDEEWEKIQKEVPVYTEKLSQFMMMREASLYKNYELFKDQAKPQIKTGKEEKIEPDEVNKKWNEPEKPTESIEPDETIPF